MTLSKGMGILIGSIAAGAVIGGLGGYFVSQLIIK